MPFFHPHVRGGYPKSYGNGNRVSLSSPRARGIREGSQARLAGTIRLYNRCFTFGKYYFYFYNPLKSLKNQPSLPHRPETSP